MQAKRLVCPAIRQLEWQTLDIPETPEPHQVIIKSVCSLISAGTEMAIYSGSHIGFSIPNPPEWLKFPMVLGYALTGTLHAVGSEVDEWKVGDQVLAHAKHSDWAIADARTTLMRRLPDEVSMTEGALARLGGISLVGVREGKVILGETVVVLGLGLIGQFAAQLSHIAGARPVIGVDLIPQRAKVAAANGIHVVDPAEVDVVQRVKEMTDGRMAEVVIEATGNPQVMPLALDLVAKRGRVVLLGSQRDKIEIDSYSTIHQKGVTLVGAHDNLSVHPYTLADPWTRERNLDLVLDLFGDGSLKSSGLISHRIRPDTVEVTYEALVERPQDFLGVLIEWNQS